MKRVLRWASAVILTLAVALLACAWQWRRSAAHTLAAHPPPGRLVDVGGRRLHLLCAGSGTPTVIFEASGFGSYRIFGRTFDGAAARTRACAYDRAGMGYSDPASQPLDARRLAADLERLLGAAEIAPPYLLVGMSTGGLVARLYAHEHPGDVVGMVLVDPLPEDFLDAMPRTRANVLRQLAAAPWLARLGLLRFVDPFGLRQRPADEAELAMALNYRAAPWLTARSLVDNFPASADQVRAAPLPRQLPLVVITHGVVGDLLGPATDVDEARAQEPRWQELQRSLAASVDGGRYLQAQGAGHLVTATHPEIVVEAIREVMRTR